MCWRFEASACFRGTRGQATVEGSAAHSRVAFGPGYCSAAWHRAVRSRVVMEAAAAEGCRALETASAADMARLLNTCTSTRRGAPVPAFNEGLWGYRGTGCGTQSGQCVSVRISHGTGPCRSWGKGWAFWALWAATASFARRFSRDEHS